MNSIGTVTMSIEAYNEMRDELKQSKESTQSLLSAIKIAKSQWSDSIEIHVDERHPVIAAYIEEQFAIEAAKYGSVTRHDSIYLYSQIGTVLSETMK